MYGQIVLNKDMLSKSDWNTVEIMGGLGVSALGRANQAWIYAIYKERVHPHLQEKRPWPD